MGKARAKGMPRAMFVPSSGTGKERAKSSFKAPVQEPCQAGRRYQNKNVYRIQNIFAH